MRVHVAADHLIEHVAETPGLAAGRKLVMQQIQIVVGIERQHQRAHVRQNEPVLPGVRVAPPLLQTRGTKIRGQHATAHELEFEAAFALQPLPDRAPHEAASAVASHNIFRADADLPATGGLRAQFDVIALLGQLKHAVPVTNVDGWELARTVEQQRFENQLARAKLRFRRGPARLRLERLFDRFARRRQ